MQNDQTIYESEELPQLIILFGGILFLIGSYTQFADIAFGYVLVAWVTTLLLAHAIWLGYKWRKLAFILFFPVVLWAPIGSADYGVFRNYTLLAGLPLYLHSIVRMVTTRTNAKTDSSPDEPGTAGALFILLLIITATFFFGWLWTNAASIIILWRKRDFLGVNNCLFTFMAMAILGGFAINTYWRNKRQFAGIVLLSAGIMLGIHVLHYSKISSSFFLHGRAPEFQIANMTVTLIGRSIFAVLALLVGLLLLKRKTEKEISVFHITLWDRDEMLYEIPFLSLIKADCAKKLRTCPKKDRRAVALQLARDNPYGIIEELIRMAERENRRWLRRYTLEDQLSAFEALGETGKQSAYDYIKEVYTPKITKETHSGVRDIPDEDDTAAEPAGYYYESYYSIEYIYNYLKIKGKLAYDLDYKIIDAYEESESGEEEIRRHIDLFDEQVHDVFKTALQKLENAPEVNENYKKSKAYKQIVSKLKGLESYYCKKLALEIIKNDLPLKKSITALESFWKQIKDTEVYNYEDGNHLNPGISAVWKIFLRKKMLFDLIRMKDFKVTLSMTTGEIPKIVDYDGWDLDWDGNPIHHGKPASVSTIDKVYVTITPL